MAERRCGELGDLLGGTSPQCPLQKSLRSSCLLKAFGIGSVLLLAVSLRRDDGGGGGEWFYLSVT